ncbi:MAG: nucleotidyl transferase AbiEii/AbiGii toxin family protein [Candidatus Micrarchaeota archaeon]
MILPQIVTKISKEEGVLWNTVEKDYFLTLLLDGVANTPKLRKALIFKGGTALRKIYFENYRYSEDLDFMLKEKITESELKASLEGIFEYLKKEYNASFNIKSVYKREWFSDIKVQFMGLQGQKNTITIDVSSDEVLVGEPEQRKVINSYYDKKFEILVYSLEEILAEKLRSLLQRNRVRDYYDCWYLMTKAKSRIDFKEVRQIFDKKVKYKNIEFTGIAGMFETSKVESSKAYYEKQVGGQVKKLPDFDKLIAELKDSLLGSGYFNWGLIDGLKKSLKDGL